jgi:hypothetical protein
LENVFRSSPIADLSESAATFQAEAIVLDFVQPLAAGRQCCGFCREARRDEPGRQGTLQHGGLNKARQR